MIFDSPRDAQWEENHMCVALFAAGFVLGGCSVGYMALFMIMNAHKNRIGLFRDLP